MSVQDKPASESRPAEIARLADALEVLAEKLGGETSLDRTILFLRIAHYTAVDGKVVQPELAKRMQMSKDVMARHVNLLSDEGDRGKAGLDVVKWTPSPADSRVRMLSSNTDGNKIVDKTLDKLHPKQAIATAAKAGK